MRNINQENKENMFKYASALSQILNDYKLIPNINPTDSSIVAQIKAKSKTPQGLARSTNRLKSDIATLIIFYPDFVYKKDLTMTNPNVTHTAIKLQESLDAILFNERNPAIVAYANKLKRSISKFLTFCPEAINVKELDTDNIEMQ